MSRPKKDGKRSFYYSCASRRKGNRASLPEDNLSSCSNRKSHRAERIELTLWYLVSALLTYPERLPAGLDEMLDRKRSGRRGNPDREAKVWLERLAEADRKRAGCQELAAKGLMTIEELAVRLEKLEASRRTASDELEAIRRRAECLDGLEQNGDTVMQFYAGRAPAELERVKPEERRRVYGMLRPKVSAQPEGTLEARGVLIEGLRVGSENGRAVCEPELAP